MSADPRYPVGEFVRQPSTDAATRARLIADIEALPSRLKSALAETGNRLDTPYREGGWTARQVVHHLADSHMNAFVRMRLAVTEINPTIKAYDEKAWAELDDSRGGPVEQSVAILEGLHARWTTFLRSLDAAAFERPLVHSEAGPMKLHHLLQLYGWHCRHHVGHITQLKTT